MPSDGTALTPHPAGWDDDLRNALEDLQLDRWRSSQALLERTIETARTWELLTSRSQLLAAAAAKGHAVEAWRKEEPDDAYAAMMHARVLTHRAVAAGRRGVDRYSVMAVTRHALVACDAAEERWPACPIPRICRLALAVLDIDPNRPVHRAHWAHPPEQHLLPVGPWPLLLAVEELDPGNREAHHRMLQCFKARGRGALTFTKWATERAKPGSPLHVLPIYAYVDDYAAQFRKGTGSSIGYWNTEATHGYVQRARDGWFAWHQDPRRDCSILDLNYLACGLINTGLPGAAPVFEAIGPFAVAAPWEQTGPRSRWQHSFAIGHRFAMKEASRR
ncbi:hypothetical protein EDD90_2042 [Streptomyces sp. Ag109_O5-1]|nr:hypothetical protein EDD90_2042 [Streptomyces sp. Ag109_O5-1]